MSVGVQRERRPGVAQDAGQGFHVHARRQSVSREGVPLWHNKDKSESPCVARSWPVCPYSFSTKNGPKIGPTGGGEKLGLHLKDKFLN